MEAKITVIKKLSTTDVYGDALPCKVSESNEQLCPVLKVGDEFIAKDDGRCPEGFCGWAWADIQRDVIHVLFDGSYPWIDDKKVAISCCTDGLRPVFFKIEKMPS